MTTRRLTLRQQEALLAADRGEFDVNMSSMTSLVRRGLIARPEYRVLGAGRVQQIPAGWRITEAGQAEAARIHAARDHLLEQDQADGLLLVSAVRCQVCRRIIMYSPAQTISEALTEHYRQVHPELLRTQ